MLVLNTSKQSGKVKIRRSSSNQNMTRADSGFPRRYEEGKGKAHRNQPYPTSSRRGTQTKTAPSASANANRQSSRDYEYQHQRHPSNKSGGQNSRGDKKPFDIRKYVENKTSDSREQYHRDENEIDRPDGRKEEGRKN